jgi:hypothetical protein
MSEVGDAAVLGFYAAGLGYLRIIAVWTIVSVAGSVVLGALLHAGSGRTSRNRQR